MSQNPSSGSDRTDQFSGLLDQLEVFIVIEVALVRPDAR